MSARRLSMERRGSQVRLCIEGIEHRLSEPAFLDLVSQSLRVLQALAREAAAADTLLDSTHDDDDDEAL